MVRAFRGAAIGAIAATLALGGCLSKEDRLFLNNGRKFDIYKNARCASLGNLFRPDRVRAVNVDAGVLGGGYYASDRYVRVTDPALIALNQQMLQLCIQVELGEITSAVYADHMTAAMGQYFGLLGPGQTAISAEAAAEAANAVTTGDDIRVRSGDIVAVANRVTAGIGNPSDDSALAAVVESVYVAALARLQAPISEQARLLVTGLFEERASGLRTTTCSSDATGDCSALEAARPVAVSFALFDHGKAVVPPPDQRRIAAFVARHCCAGHFVVYGFADETGGTDYNFALSRIRSSRVAEFVRSVQPNATIDVRNFGETDAFGDRLRDNRIVYLILRDALPKTAANPR